MSCFPMVEHFTRFRKICRTGRVRWVFIMVLPAIVVLELQIFLLQHRHVLSHASEIACREGGLWSGDSASRLEETLSVGSQHYNCQSAVVRNSGGDLTALEMATTPKSFHSPEKFGGVGKLAIKADNASYTVTKLGSGKHKVSNGNFVSTPLVSSSVISHESKQMQEKLTHSKDMDLNVTFRIYSSIVQVKELDPRSSHVIPVQSHVPASVNYSAISTDLTVVPKSNSDINITSISEMKNILFRDHAFRHAMRPRWSSAADQEMLYAKRQVQNASTVKSDQELYAPAFWNLSMFKRSYELMEKTLKVFIYREGQKPIFHQPVLDGIYASEGWFMKLIEENTSFVVDDPRKAHLFYIPFSSSTLRFSMYVPGPHAKRHLFHYLNSYIHAISTKYPFWNRTAGADHFLAACHDWAPYLTRRSMGHSIRVLCNADISTGFQLGRDVSLPHARVLVPQNPLGDLGGRPPTKRRFLAFFAGKMHGYLRPILFKHWGNKDPEMKVLARLTCGMKCKMSYAQYMKNSKYCICPRGYHVFTPRVVEAILHECVPVIISDNYVPPFFDVLNWEAFSVIVAEKDIPMLKDVLLSIPREKYMSLQLGVRKVQRHFLWHSKPVKYDMFHMILHSVWFSRLNRMRI